MSATIRWIGRQFIGFCMTSLLILAGLSIAAVTSDWRPYTQGSGTAGPIEAEPVASLEASPVAAPTPPRPAAKYWIVSLEFRGRAGEARYIVVDHAGRKTMYAIPAAYATYFETVKEGGTLALPAHHDEWDRAAADAYGEDDRGLAALTGLGRRYRRPNWGDDLFQVARFVFAE